MLGRWKSTLALDSAFIQNIVREIIGGVYSRIRHPELALCTADSLERSRVDALNPDVVKEYFDLLHKCLDSNDLLR